MDVIKEEKSLTKKDITSHFSRGKKWVFIPSHNVMFEKVIKVCETHSLDVKDKFKSLKNAYVRFNNVDSLGRVVFTIHENTSIASRLYITVDALSAVSYEQLDGTPKSMGLEKRETKTVLRDVARSTVNDKKHLQTAVADKSEGDVADKSEVVVIASHNEPQTIEEWEKFLQEEGLALESNVD